MIKYFPIISSLKNYSKNLFRGDAAAGITVGVMLIPQGMAYAMIAGLPPVYGLYAATIPLIIYALLGTSRQLAVGPVAMVSLLTATGIGAIAGTPEMYISLAISLALIVGLIQFTLGLFRLGFLVNFLSHPVISGFTSAAAIIIGMSQLKHLLGIEIDRTHFIHEVLIQTIDQFRMINWTTFALGILGIFLIITLKKINKNIPGLLITVILGIITVWAIDLQEVGIQIVGEIPKGLPSLMMPDLDVDTIQMLFPTALAISLVSFMESIAVAKSIQSKHRNYELNPDQELIALGLANVGGSFFQSYPTTGGFSRTAINNQAGAQTALASIISAILVVLTLVFLTPVFYYLPNAILASVIMVAVFSLIDIKEARYLWRVKRSDFWMLIITFLATLTFGIEQGIGIGVVLSLSVIIYRTTRPHIAVLGRVPKTNLYRNLDRFDDVEERQDILIIRFDDQLYFANATYFKEKIESLVEEKGDELKVVIISAVSINNMDSSAIHMVEEIALNLESKGLKIYFTGVKGPVRDVMSRSNLKEKIGFNNFFMSVQDGVDYFDNSKNGSTDDDHQKFTLQSND